MFLFVVYIACEALHGLLALRNIRMCFSTIVGGTLTHRTTNRKDWHVNVVALDLLWQGCGGQWESCEGRLGSISLCTLRPEHAHWVIRKFEGLHVSTDHHEAQQILSLRSQMTGLASKPVYTCGIHEEWTQRKRQREGERVGLFVPINV